MDMQTIHVNGSVMSVKNSSIEYVVQYHWDLKVVLLLQGKINSNNNSSKISKKSMKLIKLSVPLRAPSQEYKKIKISIPLCYKNF